MAAGTPVVAMKAPGAEDMIEDGINGLLADEEAGAGGLAEVVLELVQNSARRAEIGHRAQEWVKQFDVDHVTQRLLGIYEQAEQLAGEAPI